MRCQTDSPEDDSDIEAILAGSDSEEPAPPNEERYNAIIRAHAQLRNTKSESVESDIPGASFTFFFLLFLRL